MTKEQQNEEDFQMRKEAIEKAIAALGEVYKSFIIVARFSDEDDMTAFDIRRRAFLSEAIGLGEIAVESFRDDLRGQLKHKDE